MKRPNNRWAIVDRMFLDNFMVAALIELSYVGAGLIDGIVVSRMLPDGAMAAFGVAQPIFSIIAIFSGLFAIGMQTVASQALGDGRIDDCNRVFCAAVYIAGLFSLLSLLLVYFTSGPIAVLLAGKDGETA